MTRFLKRCFLILFEIAESQLMAGLPNRLSAQNLFDSEVISSLLGHCESWIGLNETSIKTLSKCNHAEGPGSPMLT